MNTRAVSRVPLIILAAALVNVVMFTAIEYMVGNRRIRLTETTDFDISNFIRVAEQSREVRSRRDPKAPEKPAQDVQQDIQRLTNVAKAGGLSGMALSLPSMDIDVGSAIGSNIAIARELTPLVRIPPEYPVQAATQGLEGYVILRFVVTETGSVADPEVLRADPPRIFDRAALRAVKGWKYQPQIREGKPVSILTFTRIVFQLED